MKKIAILGFGVVGGGIPEILSSCRDGNRKVIGQDIEIKYILDLRRFEGTEFENLVTDDINVIAEDPEIEVVAETMGGVHPAFEYSLACLKHGKSVVTSNKAVVAACGDELLRAAEENGVYYRFEAAVGGGIPLIRPFYTSLSHENIVSLDGILNGTTNFILNEMEEKNISFDEALKDAQNRGYAERDPSSDIDGLDTARKIIILTALVTGLLADEKDVHTETLRSISVKDMEGAKKAGGRIKLLGRMERRGDKTDIYVAPFIVGKNSPLYSVVDVYNALRVSCSVSGDVMYYGKGAGRLPTAGAVVADIVSVLGGAVKNEYSPKFEKSADFITPFEDISFEYYIRLKEPAHLPYGKLSDKEFITPKMTQKELVCAFSGYEIESAIKMA